MLKLFRVLNNENDQTVDGIDYPILINLDQIVTIKPIRIMFQGHIIDGTGSERQMERSTRQLVFQLTLKCYSTTIHTLQMLI